MLGYLKRHSQHRAAWLTMACVALLLEFIALYLQHVRDLQPCVLCIYQRCALLGIFLAGVLGSFAPNTPLRWGALFLWLYSSWRGVIFAWQNTQLTLYPTPFQTCDFKTNFPDWLPLDQWFPSFFESYAQCSSQTWSLLGLIIPQWMLFIFLVFFMVAVLVTISQFTKD